MAATLTDEARVLGKAYIHGLLIQWAVSEGTWKDLLATNTTLKSCAVVRLRRRLVRTLRERCWQDHRQRPENFLIDCTEPGAFPGQWHPLSTTNIADLLNLTHGTVVHALQRTAVTVTSEGLGSIDLETV